MIDRRTRNVALLVAACFFMEFLDGMIVVTAIPQISESLAVEPQATGLIVTAYLVTVAVVIPLSSWLTLRYGYRRVFLTAIAVFTLASIGCAASTALTQLVAMRILQGVGGAMMVPVGRMIVFETAAKDQVMRLMSFIVWPALVAPVVAPLAGGLIVTYASWRWLFLINIPLGVVAFLFAWRMIKGGPSVSAPRLDILGGVLTAAGLGALIYAADTLSHENPDWWFVVGLVCASAVALAIAARHLLSTTSPLVDLRTLHIRTFAFAMAGTGLAYTVIGAIPFLLPLLFQAVFEWSPVKSGAVVMAVFLGNITIKPATTFLYSRFGFRSILIATSACLAVTTAACGLLTAETPLAATLGLALVSGAARSVAMTGYSTLALSDVPPDMMRSANALASVAHQLFIGLAVAVAMVGLRIGDPLGELFLDDDSQSAYTVAFLLMAGIAVLATVVAWRMPSSAGEALVSRRQARSEEPVTI